MKYMILLCLLCTRLYAEVEQVIVTWVSMECQTTCITQLRYQFQKIPGVQDVAINPGRAEIKWKPNVPFSFSPINVAMELLGITINDIRVRAHGTLSHGQTNVTLTSIGDHTRFDLLNPVVPEISGQAAEYNIGARYLRPALRQKLVEAEKDGLEATIEGPLLFPERSPPLELVVDHVSFKKPEKPKK